MSNEKQQIAVIGLGRFGSAVAEELHKAGHEVIGIDLDRSIVQSIASKIPHTVQVDAVDEVGLRQLGIEGYDAAVVGITDELEASILITLVLKHLNVKQIVVKARNEMHGEILQRVGADRIIYPERDTGLRLAHSWFSADITASLDIVDGYEIIRVRLPQNFVGLQVNEVVNKLNKVQLIMIARGSIVIEFPDSAEVLQKDDILVLSGKVKQIEKFFLD
ncbi:MAG: trk system potassium uptake protein TrkA [Chloroflexi bacterium]|jgi:trk system potassium uptake protein TrkA|nr:MAG: trk system potassium uptake protein TrkA [Chloroflexota bacterium]|tara:strand:+ start:7775 stop:8431 length:657 start_codon:yes stop_codon:yes gene_type:complete